jgi:ATP-binding cassette subfamily F protein 3
VTVNVYRGDKLGVVGPNGSGKSTLLKTLIGELAPLAGKVEFGSGVRIGYFDQKLGTLSEELTLIDEIRSVRADLSPEYVRTYLAKFRFFGDDPFRTVRGLSGGERSRLAMAKIMLFPRNVLVLDEPTNHLDIPARETLEDALSAYEGTLLVVSHDRYFLDRICTRLLVIDGTSLEAHLGNYSDWRRRRREQAAKETPRETPKTAPKTAPGEASKETAKLATTAPRPGVPRAATATAAESEATRAANKERERGRRRLEKRVETLEADVGKLEAELRTVREGLTADHAGDWQKLHTLADRERELDALLARKMNEWETASAALSSSQPSSP